ncbi:sulfotransferase [bacterium]|nr:sulfotransferase [bacterium]
MLNLNYLRPPQVIAALFNILRALDEEQKKKDILLMGVPRSGTSWFSQILSANGKLKLIHEPDNELNSFLALHYKAGLNRYPYLKKVEKHPAYKKLFDVAFNYQYSDHTSRLNRLSFILYNKPKKKLQESIKKHGTAALQKPIGSSAIAKFLVKGEAKKRRLVKSVHGLLSLPFLLDRFDVKPVVIIRNPLSVYSSYVSLKMPDGNRRIFKRKKLLEDFGVHPPNLDNASKAKRAGFQLAFFYKVIEKYNKKFDDLLVVKYEDILDNPLDEIKAICRELNIEYSEKIQQYIKDHMKKGSGYATYRDPKEQKEVWRKRLSEEEVQDFLEGYFMLENEFKFNLPQSKK